MLYHESGAWGAIEEACRGWQGARTALPLLQLALSHTVQPVGVQCRLASLLIQEAYRIEQPGAA